MSTEDVTAEIAAVLAEHRGWAETGPNDNGSWNLVCHTCGDHLLTMWGTYVSEDDRDDLFANHQADALADLLAARDRRVRAEAWGEGYTDSFLDRITLDKSGPLAPLTDNPYREADA